jgi:hypothetical protein
MKLVTYRAGSEGRLGVLDGNRLVDLQRAGEAIGKRLPHRMRAFIALGDAGLDDAEAALRGGAGQIAGEVRLAAPLPDLAKNILCVGHNYKAHHSCPNCVVSG